MKGESMSDEWIPVTKFWPSLPGKTHLHVLNCPRSELVEWLEGIGFSVVEFISPDRATHEFLGMAAQALGFEPAYLDNWDAWEDCLTEWSWSAPKSVALIWSESDKVFSQDANLFSQIVFDLTRLAWSMALPNTKLQHFPKQLEVFVLGRSTGYARLAAPERPKLS
jgi:hypothetical protein